MSKNFFIEIWKSSLILLWKKLRSLFLFNFYSKEKNSIYQIKFLEGFARWAVLAMHAQAQSSIFNLFYKAMSSFKILLAPYNYAKFDTTTVESLKWKKGHI